MFRRKFHLSFTEVRGDLDAYWDTYKTPGPHDGYRAYGRPRYGPPPGR
jgi:hypothetical protein